MIRFLWIIALIPIAALAEPVAIRSGEHASFSRLVLSVPEGADWSVSQDPDAVTIEIDGNIDGFDTSEIFERIPKTRISNTSQLSNTELELEVTCACTVDAFLWRPNRLVVDIVDGTGSEEEGPRLVVQDPSGDTAADVTSLPDLLALQRSQTLPQVIPSVDPSPALSAQDADLAATEAALVEGLARAATQGFLDAAQPLLPGVEEPEVEPEPIVPEPEIQATTVVSPHPGIGISTALDRDLALLGTVIENAIDQHCLPADLFAVREWAGDEEFHRQAAVLIEDLVGEFGQVPPDAEENLARFYVSFGFGAEAQMVLSSDGVSSQSRSVLEELAGVVDEMEQQYPLIQSQSGCATPGALWAFLLDPTPLDVDSANQIQQFFFDLPQPLRGQLSPRLARAFVDVGDPDSAEKVLRATQNQDIETSHQAQSAQASVNGEFGSSELELSVLAEEADDNPRITPESIIRLIELSIQQDQTPRDEDLLLAEALAQEFRNEPIAQDVFVALAKGRAMAGQFSEALELVNGREDDAASDARNFIYERLNENSEPVEFLEVTYQTVPNDLTSTTQNNVARRLIDLGFAERATDFLKGPAEREAAAERRYLRAEAAVSMRDYPTAIEAVQGMSDERARELLSLAYSGMGEHQAALSALDARDLEGDQATLHFRAQAWDRLSLQNDEVLSTFAERVLEEPLADPPVTLADRQTLLSQSEESRRAVEDLLLRFDGGTDLEDGS